MTTLTDYINPDKLCYPSLITERMINLHFNLENILYIDSILS